MASKAEVMRQRRMREGFDVTCTIGRVEFDATGEQTPHEAAFLLIARHDAPGTYRFPAVNGDEVVVTVEYTGA